MKSKVKLELLIAALSLVGAVLILYGISKYGPGVTHDSAAYAYAAQSMLTGRGYIYFGYGTPFIQWPPLYPTVLAVFGSWAIHPVTVAGCLNAVVFGLIIFVCGIWLSRNIYNKALVLIGTAAVLFSIPLIQVSVYAWSEALFTLFMLLSLFTLLDFNKSHRYSSLIAASIFAALSCLTRYTGVTVVGTGLLVLLFQKRRIRSKLTDISIFGCLSTIPLAVWMVRNYAVSRTLLGTRTPSTTPWLQNIKLSLKTVLSWFTPYGGLVKINAGIERFFQFLTVSVFMGLTVCFTVHVLSHLTGKRKVPGVAGVFGCFAGVYSIYLIGSASSVAFDPIGTRLLMPAAIPMLLYLLLVVDQMVKRIREEKGKSLLQNLMIALVTISFLAPGVGSLPAFRYLAQNGAGAYASQLWQESDLIRYSRTHPFQGQVYSNYPDALYLLSAVDARYTPKKSGPFMYGLERFKERIAAQKESYLVWFNNGSANSLYNVDELRAYFDIMEVVKVSDGTVYRIQAK